MDNEMQRDFKGDCEKAFDAGFEECKRYYGPNWRVELQDICSFALRAAMIFIALQVGYAIWCSMVITQQAMKWDMCDQVMHDKSWCIANTK